MAEDTTLDDLITSQLSSLNLKSDEETTEFVKGLIEEPSFEQDVGQRPRRFGSVTLS